jgi:SAM-dependent methyltransferase
MADDETIKTYESLAERWTDIRQRGEVLGRSRVERPAMLRMLPEIKGKTVLCLGCGSSDECQLMFDKGASYVMGLDASEKMIEIAKQETPGASFVCQDLDELNMQDEKFDVVWASLALHYSTDFTTLLERIYNLLKDEGEVLFSLPHPVYYGAYRKRDGDKRQVLTGFERDGNKLTVHGDCLEERLVSEKLHGEFPVSFYVRSLSTVINQLIAKGFTILGADEPKAELPLADDTEETKMFIERHQQIPLVMVLRAKKQS